MPQGSILGPLLFLLYINDLPNQVQHNCIMFADDTTLIIKSDNLDNFNKDINDTLVNVIHWLNNNNLKININKTCIMQFRTYRSADIDLDIHYETESVEEVESTKFLGIHIDKFCSWKCHVANVCDRLDKFVFALRRLSRISSKAVALTAYHGYVSSILSYGLLIWGNSVDVHKAFLAQKKCVRAVCNVHFQEPCRPLFKSTKVLPLPCMYILQASLFVREHLEYFDTNSKFFPRSTRRRNQIFLPRARKNVFKNNVYSMVIQIYNKLPKHILETEPRLFKNALCKWLLLKCYYSIQEFMSDENQ